MTKMHGANEEKPEMMPNWMWISAAVKYAQVPKGERLTLTPKDPTQLCVRGVGGVQDPLTNGCPSPRRFTA